ncbi:MAG: 6-carboxytetrahydropterin synthase [Gemmatimonadota bacterium]|nr:6-carboxytetrahydropterin synthase [Gemmatimonadota bacterium]
MSVSLTRTVTFHARHRYWVSGWTADENRRQFGWTSEEPAHGHHYQCAVSVAGPLDPTTTMIMDLSALDQILAEEVLVLDGCELSATVPEFANQGQQPSCEALASVLFARLAPRMPSGVSLARIRITEDATLHADCTGLP